MKLLELMTGPWAVLPETLTEMQRIYATHLRGEKIDIAAVEARLGRPLASEQQEYMLRDGGVAVLPVAGVMSPKANLLMRVSGGVSTQTLAQQFASLESDPRVRSAVVVWDSPGGNVLGVPAAVDALRSLAAAKPTVSVIENTMASAAAWVGTGANAVYLSGTTDMVGSLGVILRLDWDPANPNAIEMVRGKYKRASVNGQAPSAEVLAYHEAQLDHLYTLLVNGVADNRGTTPDAVLEHMADGRVFIGQQAIDAGLVDGVSTVEAMVDQLATNPDAYRRRRKAVIALGAPTPLSASAGDAPKDDITPPKGSVMPQADNTLTRESFQRDHATLHAQLQADFTAQGAAQERARIQAVREQLMPGHEALVDRLAFDGKTTGPEAAMAVLQAERATLAAAQKAHHADAPPAAPPSAAPADKPEKNRAEMAAEAERYAKEHKVDIVAALKALGYAS